MNNQLWPIPTGTSIICNYLNANVHASQLLVICMSLFHLRLSIGSDFLITKRFHCHMLGHLMFNQDSHL